MEKEIPEKPIGLLAATEKWTRRVLSALHAGMQDNGGFDVGPMQDVVQDALDEGYKKGFETGYEYGQRD